MTRQENTKQHETRHEKTRHDKTRQDNTRQHKTRRDTTRHNKTSQDTTSRDKTRQDKSRHKTRVNRLVKSRQRLHKTRHDNAPRAEHMYSNMLYVSASHIYWRWKHITCSLSTHMVCIPTHIGQQIITSCMLPFICHLFGHDSRHIT